MIFIDEAVIHVGGGNGGNGCVAFRREKYVPRGGPSGGNGGNGGSVYLVGRRDLSTLQHLRYNSHHKAERGRHGEGSDRTGRCGESKDVLVPLGTVVFDRDSGEVLAEILEDGARVAVGQGGRGGRGNASYASARQRTPRYAQPGAEGEERSLRLELKLLADVGLVGLPNAGKSTLISTISAARPKIADYPFTTLVPQLGVVSEGQLTDPFVVADLPGLIAGAASGAGLGHQFLRHVERCRVLVHMVDLASFDEDGAQIDAEEDLLTLEQELKAFNPDLLERSRMVVGTKSDSAVEPRRASLKQAAEKRGLVYLEISSATHRGLDALILELRARLREAKRQEAKRREAEEREVEEQETRPRVNFEEREDEA